MANLFKYEFRKIYTSKLFYVCLVICAAFVLFNLALLKLLEIAAPAINEMAGTEEEADVVISFTGYTPVHALISGISNSSLTLVGAVFISLYVSEDYRNGVIKNIYGKGYSRPYVFIAKYVISLAAMLVMAIVSLLLSFVLGLLFFGSDMDAPGNLVYNLLTQVLVVVAYHAVFFAITMAISKIGIVIVINILGFGLFSIVVALLDAGIDHLFEVGSFSLNQYWLGNFFGTLSGIEVKTQDITTMLICSILYTIGAFTIGYLFTKRRDV